MSEEGMEQTSAVERGAAMLEVDEHAPDKARQAHAEALGAQIVEALKTCFDPEIPVNIYELGLIYRIDVEDDDSVLVEMTLTSPHCPVAESLPVEVQEKVEFVEGVKSCKVELAWEPPWHPSMMTEEAQLELGMIY